MFLAALSLVGQLPTIGTAIVATGIAASANAHEWQSLNPAQHGSWRQSPATTNSNVATNSTVTSIGTMSGTCGKVTLNVSNIYAGASLSGVNTYSFPTTVQTGTLELVPRNIYTPSTTVPYSGKLVLDYTGAAPDVLTPLKASHDASPSWSTGQLRNTTAGTTGLVLGWKSDTSVERGTIMGTLAGDANLDGSVTGADLSNLLSNFNQAGSWISGDFNHDTLVTGADLSLLLSKLDQSISATAFGMAATVGIAAPEPSSLVLLAGGLLGVLAYAFARFSISAKCTSTQSARISGS